MGRGRLLVTQNENGIFGLQAADRSQIPLFLFKPAIALRDLTKCFKVARTSMFPGQTVSIVEAISAAHMDSCPQLYQPSRLIQVLTMTYLYSLILEQEGLIHPSMQRPWLAGRSRGLVLGPVLICQLLPSQELCRKRSPQQGRS